MLKVSAGGTDERSTLGKSEDKTLVKYIINPYYLDIFQMRTFHILCPLISLQVQIIQTCTQPGVMM